MLLIEEWLTNPVSLLPNDSFACQMGTQTYFLFHSRTLQVLFEQFHSFVPSEN